MKMKKLLLSALFCIGAITVSAQQLEWYSLWGSSTEGSHIRPVRMLVDNDNNTYVATSFSGNAVKIEENTLVSKQGGNLGDAALVKMGTNKQPAWTVTFAEEKQVSIADIVFDGDNNIVVVGTFTGTLNPNRQGKLEMYTGEFGDMVLNGFVARFDKNGQLLSQWSIPAFELSSIRVAADKNNNVYVAGSYGSSLYLEGSGSPDKGEYGKDNQYFLAKYTSMGALTWSKVTTLDGLMVTNVTVGVDVKTSDVYFAGSFGGTLSLAGKTLTTVGSDMDMFITKINTDGTELWAKQLGGDAGEKASEIAISPIGDVALGGLSASSSMTISEVDSTFAYKHRAGADFAVTTAFSKDGDFRWQYFYGYGDTGATVGLFSLRCSSEGIYYMALSGSGRFGDISAGGIIEGKNSGIWSVDKKHFSHNTNGGIDAICTVLSPDGGLVNIMRPGGQQTEKFIDIALTNDKKGIYLLYEFVVRKAIAQIPLDNFFVSFTDLNKNNKTGDFTMITVPCPETVAVGGSYSDTYVGSFFSACLSYCSFPTIDPEELPIYVTNNAPYSVDLNLGNKKGEAVFTALSLPEGLTLENNILKGTLVGNDTAYYVTVVATDATPRVSYFAAYASDTTWDNANPDNLSSRGLNRNTRNFVLKVDDGNSIQSENLTTKSVFLSNIVRSELLVTTDESDFIITIYSMLGKEVLNSRNERTISIDDLTPGIYIAKFEANGRKVTERIIVQ